MEWRTGVGTKGRKKGVSVRVEWSRDQDRVGSVRSGGVRGGVGWDSGCEG